MHVNGDQHIQPYDRVDLLGYILAIFVIIKNEMNSEPFSGRIFLGLKCLWFGYDWLLTNLKLSNDRCASQVLDASVAKDE